MSTHASNPPYSQPEIQRILKRLVQYVARTFYEPKHIVLLDLLVRNPVIKDDELAGMMDMKLKDVQKIAADLANASLVKLHRQNELKDGAVRASPKTYYYIDYIHFCNVVKWRVWRMQKRIDSSTRNVIDFMSGELICEACKGPVIEYEGAGAEGGNTRLQRFNQQIHLITSGLRKVDEAGVLPAFDVVAHVKAAHVDTQRGKNEPGAGLRIAGEGGSRTQEAAVGVVLAAEGDEAAARAARDAAADARRQQNALPAWHLRSTVSGGLTALGIREQEREERERGERGEANGAKEEDPLSGFGVVGGGKPRVKQEEDLEDTKGISMATQSGPSTQAEPAAADLDMWYAGVSVGADVATPYPSDPNTPYTPYSTNTPPEDDDEDDAPRVVTSLSAWRKRSREEEDEGRRVRVKAEEGESGVWGGTNGYSSTNGYGATNGATNGYSTTTNGFGAGDFTMGGSQGTDVMMASQGTDVSMAEGGDDPTVFVQGQPYAYSAVTEELYEQMTEDEMTAYVEVMQARGA
ncbi:TFIIE alpha subunit-domain-containing protein [Schizophyllum commune]